MVQLQRPDWVYFGGRVRPYEEAVLHISMEGVFRGLNVFEGLKGYWSADGATFSLLEMRRHYDRLCRSAALLHIPMPCGYDGFERACFELLERMVQPSWDMWIRATLYVVEGHWGEDTRADLTLLAYHQPRERPAPISVGVSTWQRATDPALPARIKTSTNYQAARLARIEGRRSGFSEMILLNGSGRVAEFTGACVVMVREGVVTSPPPWEGALESITLRIVLALADELGIPATVRPIDRTELYVCDELAEVGTLAELTPVINIDGRGLPLDRPTVTALQDRFFDMARGGQPNPAAVLTPVPLSGGRSVLGREDASRAWAGRSPRR
jgi:branched-chain amino acid aminotransferase